MNDTDVLVVGAGPTGLALGASLTARGIRVALVDKLAEGENTSRAAAVNARTLEVLEDLDVASRMVKAGLIAPRFTMREGRRVLISIDFSQLPTAHPYTLMLSQADTERLLLQRLHELGGEVIRPKTLTRLAQDADGVTATFDDGETLRAGYVVGTDGMHSTVRQEAGIGFAGGKFAESFALADVRLAGEAAHVHSPAGGQCMNLGITDAIALADALANVVHGGSDTALDAYATGQRRRAEQVLKLTGRLTRISTLPGPVRPIRNSALR